MMKKSMMKINWGTGIFIFLVVFVIAIVSFVIFTLQFDANLVHKDYYEKGVDYSEQMRVDARSKIHSNAFQAQSTKGEILLNIQAGLSDRIDSGNIHVFRPSDRNMDLDVALNKAQSEVRIPGESLIKGRYILQVAWYMDGVKYEVDKMVVVE